MAEPRDDLGPSDVRAVGEQARKVRRTAIMSASIAGGMLALAFASVPLYDLFCRVTGFGGTPMIASTAASRVSDKAITVRFDSNVARDLAWRFSPERPAVEPKLGETMTVSYRVRNTGSTPSVGIATFNVQPEAAGQFFNKIACFCFNEIPLQPGEEREETVVFFIDPALEEHPELKTLNTITLSYTFFRSRNGEPVSAAASGSPNGS
jgi:cytochrome c oxidase assembly protein subunit 11